MSYPGSPQETPDAWIERSDYDLDNESAGDDGPWCAKCEHWMADCRCPDPDEAAADGSVFC